MNNGPHSIRIESAYGAISRRYNHALSPADFARLLAAMHATHAARADALRLAHHHQPAAKTAGHP